MRKAKNSKANVHFQGFFGFFSYFQRFRRHLADGF